MPPPMPSPTVTPTATPANTTTPPTVTTTSTTPPPNTTTTTSTPPAPTPADCPSILDLVAASEDLSTLGMAVQVHQQQLANYTAFPVFPNCSWWCPTHAAKQLLPPESMLLF